MNSYDRIYNTLIEGETTGGSPTQTGRRVRRAVKKLKAQGKFTAQKRQQVADIGTRTSSRQGKYAARDWTVFARRADVGGDREGLYGYEDSSRRAEKDRTQATIAARRRYDAARKGD